MIYSAAIILPPTTNSLILLHLDALSRLPFFLSSSLSFSTVWCCSVVQHNNHLFSRRCSRLSNPHYIRRCNHRGNLHHRYYSTLVHTCTLTKPFHIYFFVPHSRPNNSQRCNQRDSRQCVHRDNRHYIRPCNLRVNHHNNQS